MDKQESDTQKLVKLYFRCKPHPEKKDAEVVGVSGDGMALANVVVRSSKIAAGMATCTTT